MLNYQRVTWWLPLIPYPSIFNSTRSAAGPAPRRSIVMAACRGPVQLLPLRRFQGIDGNEILQELHLRNSVERSMEEDFLVFFWIGKWTVMVHRCHRGMVKLLFLHFPWTIVIICYHFVMFRVIDAWWLVNGCVFWYLDTSVTLGYMLIIPDLYHTTTIIRRLIQQPVARQDGSNWWKKRNQCHSQHSSN